MVEAVAPPLERYQVAAEALRRQLEREPAGAPVRLGKRTSNLFRERRGAATALDVGAFTSVLSVDPGSRTADVGGMTTYEDLVAATLPFGLMPTVVPQLKTITLGGAVAGLGIESTSFRAGLVHEAVQEVDVLTGDARVLTASADGPHAELFRALPNAYGTLGYALRLRIALAPTQPFVQLEHRRYRDADACTAALAQLCDDPELDFLDGVAFGPDELYLTLGRFVATARSTSDYTGREIFYRSLQAKAEDHLTVHDYLWRWDTDWFWCSAAFGAQHPLVRRVWPRRWRRSDVYWKLVALDRRTRLSERVDRLRNRPPRERIVQDVEVAVAALPAFLDVLRRETAITPVWLCPVRTKEPWSLYPMEPGRLYVNVGFWSSAPLAPGEPDGTHNRRLEEALSALGGHKSLYSTATYAREEFWERYGGTAYWPLKQAYDPAGRFPDLYEKCVLRA